MVILSVGVRPVGWARGERRVNGPGRSTPDPNPLDIPPLGARASPRASGGDLWQGRPYGPLYGMSPFGAVAGRRR